MVFRELSYLWFFAFKGLSSLVSFSLLYGTFPPSHKKASLIQSLARSFSTLEQRNENLGKEGRGDPLRLRYFHFFLCNRSVSSATITTVHDHEMPTFPIQYFTLVFLSFLTLCFSCIRRRRRRAGVV